MPIVAGVKDSQSVVLLESLCPVNDYIFSRNTRAPLHLCISDYLIR